MKGLSIKRITALLLSLLVAMSMLAVSTGTVNAEENWAIDVTTPLYVGQTGDIEIYDKNDENALASITSMKSSDESIVKIKTDNTDGWKTYHPVGVKHGVATITVKFENTDGQERSGHFDLYVQNYPKAIKSLKINGKSVKISKNKFHCKKKGKSSNKIKLKLAKGWKIAKVYGETYNPKTTSSHSIKSSAGKKILNGKKKLKLTKKEKKAYLTFKLKKGSESFWYTIDIYRK